MNLAQIIEHFNILTEAPGGTERLRGLALRIAFEGNLVERQADEGTGDAVVSALRKNLELLVKDKTIKKDREAYDEVKRDDLPEHWSAAFLGQVVPVIRGASPRPKGDPRYFSSERTPYHWIKISDIRKHRNGKLLSDTDEFLTEAGKEKSILMPEGTLVLTNSATVGVPIFLGIQGCIHDGYLAFPHFPTDHLSPDYAYCFFLDVRQRLIGRARGMAQLNINTSIAKKLRLPLPPLEEQKRIVAKVDELMAQIDALEEKQKKRNQTRRAFTTSALHALSTADSAEAVRDSWNRVRSSWGLLEANPKDFKQTVRLLAVCGYLSNSGERARVELSDGWLPVPGHWKTRALGEFGTVFGGGTPSKRNAEYWDGSIPWVSPKAMKVPTIFDTELRVTPLAVQESSVKMVPKGALLMVVRGMILAHSFPVALAGTDVTLNQDMKAITLPDDVTDEFGLLALQAARDIVLGLVERSSHGTCRLPTKELFALEIPIPPLAEQKEILERIAQVESLTSSLFRIESERDDVQKSFAMSLSE